MFGWLTDVERHHVSAFLDAQGDVAETTERVPKSGEHVIPRVFICHSKHDERDARHLSELLRSSGYDTWLDRERLQSGMRWEEEIRRAIFASDVVLVVLSHKAVSRPGYVHTEIRYALEIADSRPRESTAIIPVLLDELELPGELSNLQPVRYFEPDARERLVEALPALSLN
jgi:hypothetical protein